MIHLFVTLKGHTVGRFDLEQDQVRLGRNAENDVVLDTQAVSRQHCSLVRSAEGWRLEDHRSGNGTFLNGARIQERVPLKDEDVVGVGPFQVLIRTVEVGGQSTGQGPELRERAAPLKGFLVFENRVGREVLIEQDVLQIGSAADVDLRVDGPPKLALLVRGYGGFQLVNVAPGAAVIQVGGVDVSDRRWLQDGDRLRLGELELTLHEGSPTGGEGTMQIPLSALRIPPPGGLPEARPADPPSS